MWRLAAAVALVVLAAPAARAQERAGSAALGALSGAVVLGPVGAVAGAVVGYTAGPAIARSWGLSAPPPRRKRPATPRRAPQQAASAQPMPRPHPRAAPRAPAAARAAGGAAPPMQGFE
jgi:hypothetical protein